MTLQLKLLIRVVTRRVKAGEDIEAVLQSYPKLTAEEAEIVRQAVNHEGGRTDA